MASEVGPFGEDTRKSVAFARTRVLEALQGSSLVLDGSLGNFAALKATDYDRGNSHLDFGLSSAEGKSFSNSLLFIKI